MSNCYYVYAYLDPSRFGTYTYDEYSFNAEPYYIGKGHDDRMFYHLLVAESEEESSTFVINKTRSLLRNCVSPVIVKVKDNISEAEAFELEKTLINLIGRRCLGTGPLTNIAGGGQGCSLGGEPLLERNRKISIGRTGCKMPKHTKEHNDKIAEGLRNQPSRLETVPRFNDNIKKFLVELPSIKPSIRSNSGIYWYIVFSKSGDQYGVAKGDLKNFCRRMNLSVWSFTNLSQEFSETGKIRFGRNDKMRDYASLRFSSIEDLRNNLIKGQSAAELDLPDLEGSTTIEKVK